MNLIESNSHSAQQWHNKFLRESLKQELTRLYFKTAVAMAKSINSLHRKSKYGSKSEFAGEIGLEGDQLELVFRGDRKLDEIRVCFSLASVAG